MNKDLEALKDAIQEWAEDHSEIVRYPELFADNMVQEAMIQLGLEDDWTEEDRDE